MKYFEVCNNKIKCIVCPRECVLSEGQKGFCKVRENKNGKINLIPYNFATGLAMDPIEKKPLYHFYPSSKVLSFGTFGCNMGCKFCQNYHMSKFEQNFDYSQKATPEMIVETAKKYFCKSVAFTYNDPICFFEYALDCAKLCREAGIKTIAVTSGFINPEPAKEFFRYIDAANIDLKGFSENFYGKNCLAKLEPVLNTIKYVTNETDCVVELTTLLIDGENTNSEDFNLFSFALGAVSSGVGIYGGAFCNELFWRGKNGNWYQHSQIHTQGGYAYSYSLAKKAPIQIAGNVLAGFSIALELAEMRKNKKIKPSNVINIAMSAASFSGVGAIVAGSYFIIDNVVLLTTGASIGQRIDNIYDSINH